MLATLSAAAWWEIAAGLVATLLRVAVSLLIAMLWAVPVGILVGIHPRLAAVWQPVFQVTASGPATALFSGVQLVFLYFPWWP